MQHAKPADKSSDVSGADLCLALTGLRPYKYAYANTS